MRCFFNQTGTSEPTVYTQYLYAGGARVKKITRKSSGDKYVTVYIDGIFEHSYHLDGSNDMDEVLNELHVMDDQTRVAMLRTGYDDGTPFTKYILSDHLGSSNVILETSGAVYNREEYYPFGETSFGAFGKKRYRYVGKEKDEESGLYYYGARYFQPWSCRFISVDPLAGKYAQLTPYNYAANDPIGDLDIDGMQTPSTDTSAKSDTTSTVQQAQSETKKPATSPLPEQGNDIFDEKGNYIRTESNNQKENNIYIINKAGEKKLLSNYAFDKKNASALASIAKHYSQFSDTKSSSLLNGNFSVAMRKETPIIGESGKPLGLPETESVPLFNKGVTSTILGETSIMTSSWEGNGSKKITVSVDNSGYINDKLNDKFNFINTLQHEGQHKQGDSQSEFNHLDIYLNQIKHPSWQLTTGDYKANAINNIKEIIFLAKTWQGSKGQSQSDIQAIHKGAIIYENKFKKRLPQY
jgi:RHS repeat-associated protein